MVSSDSYSSGVFAMNVDKKVEVEFQNTLIEDLIVKKTVTGSSAPTSSTWAFDVKLSGSHLTSIAGTGSSFNLPAVITDALGAENPVTITFTKGGDGKYAGEVSVPAGGFATIKGIPAKVVYEVSEKLGITSDDGAYKTIATSETGTITSGSDSTASFVNDYVDPVSVAFAAKKSLTIYGVDTSIGSSGLSFGFKMTPGTPGTKMPGGLTEVVTGCDGSGNISFGTVEYTYSNVGQHVYIIEETDKTNPYVTYDSAVYEVTVDVSRNTSTNELEMSTSITKDGASYTGTLAFVNEYNPPIIPPTPTASASISASKTLDGKAPESGKFSFQLKDDKGNVVATATNSASGAISFGSMSFDKPGTYKYTISEVAGTDKSVKYDSSVHNVTVTVTEDASGKLSATVSYSGTPAFANKTKYEPVDVAFGATKTLDGKEPGSNAFLFALSKDGVIVEKSTNSASGTIAFGSQSFDTEGVYKFTLSEIAGTDDGFEYDNSVYEITVTVTKGKDSKLVATTSVAKNGAAYDGIPAFANSTVEEEEPDPELPDTGGDPKPDGPIASTGDGSPILPFVAGLVLAMAAAAIALVMKRRDA
ncbi:MAG: VCBS domain-containing protein [Eggerthellaceae bacterium]|nr:VCBS domain-containing protein [Eggerthellaceae bacterium]